MTEKKHRKPVQLQVLARILFPIYCCFIDADSGHKYVTKHKLHINKANAKEYTFVYEANQQQNATK